MAMAKMIGSTFLWLDLLFDNGTMKGSIPRLLTSENFNQRFHFVDDEGIKCIKQMILRLPVNLYSKRDADPSASGIRC